MNKVQSFPIMLPQPSHYQLHHHHSHHHPSPVMLMQPIPVLVYYRQMAHTTRPTTATTTTMESPISSSSFKSPQRTPECYSTTSSSKSPMNSPSPPITKEDVLKKFLDSKKVKSPNSHETPRRLPPSRPTSEKESIREKNVIHGVHIPPKMLAHSLRKKENKYFYFSTVSKFEGNIHDLTISSRTTASTLKSPFSQNSSTVSQPSVSPIHATSSIEASRFSSNSSFYCGSFATDNTVRNTNVGAEFNRQSIKA
uniref:Uncharacterized protein n=1 Tax=Panagrolaimus sp. PS1159 TaxID=55785 RepID=A0AC35FXF7_9BILA